MKNLKLKKKLVGGHRVIYYFLFCIFFLFSKNLHSSEIYDYQTENFINKLNSYILSVNSYDKKLVFKIVSDDFPNAYVTQNNIIYLSSGLLTYSPDYVSILGVLAHEIGHIEKYHISKRKKEIKNLKNISSIGNVGAVLGSMIMQEPGLINAIIVNQTSVNNLFVNFSQDQEIEADFYAVETLNNLNLPTDSIKELLLILEDQTKFNITDKELLKFSTHPLFAKRYEILNYKKNQKNYNFNEKLQNEFAFIKAKFMAYTNSGSYNQLKGDYKIYYDSIQDSKSGNLFESLKKINVLISKYNKSSFLIETKADILLSYGYNKEAIEFYKKVLINQPNNDYVKFNIFINMDFKNQKNEMSHSFFVDNLNLLNIFPKNQILITKYYNLSKIYKYEEWILFFEILLSNKSDLEIHLNQLKKDTEDSNLLKLIKIYT